MWAGTASPVCGESATPEIQPGRHERDKRGRAHTDKGIHLPGPMGRCPDLLRAAVQSNGDSIAQAGRGEAFRAGSWKGRSLLRGGVPPGQTARKDCKATGSPVIMCLLHQLVKTMALGCLV